MKGLTAKDFVPWLTLGAALLAAGMYIGRLEQRITALEKTGTFLHGDLTAFVTKP